MGTWTKDATVDELRSALDRIYFKAKMKRTITYNYPTDGEPIQIGPSSHDTDWDGVIEVCERVGLRPTAVIPMENT